MFEVAFLIDKSSIVVLKKGKYFVTSNVCVWRVIFVSKIYCSYRWQCSKVYYGIYIGWERWQYSNFITYVGWETWQCSEYSILQYVGWKNVCIIIIYSI